MAETAAADVVVIGDDAPDDDLVVESLGQRIRRLRVARGLTQQQVVGTRYTRAFLGAVESGARAPSPEALAYVARRLGVPVDDLRYGRPPGVADQLAAEHAAARRALSAGQVAAAEQALTRIRRRADHYRLPELAGWAGYHLAEAQLHRGLTEDAAARYDELARAVPDGCPALRAAVLARQAYCLLVTGDAPRAVAILEGGLRALRATPPVDADAELRLTNALMYTFLELSWRDRARRLERDVSPLLDRVANQEWVAQFHAIAGQLRRDGELAEADHHLREAGRRYAELGLTREIGLCRWARGYVLLRAGRPGEAGTELRRAREILGAVGAVLDEAGATLELAEARRREGVLDEAGELAEHAARTATACDHRELMAEADRVRGLVRAAQGDADQARRLLLRAVDRYERAGLMGDVVITCRHLAELLLAGAERDAAAAVLRRGLRAAERLS
ncbi:helix-turn-helix transcriptional regulator [Micromonospora sp. C28SCA-DRY-2]|uniref:helix-turn-helix domain-containing protein n=1 Tax=Micromonospora sp. C28SCA-DRY-2 TaxID=3059522 RepID=UPI002675476D|nr:helix-turn-helix transcriptional regulator [Micromonospora sp. C28SCA-DRY-2]MDO3704819.1 helix-turn-helix transcriptional regulator [Micromonospora sp. C28SCA-DRY-2]